MSETANQGLSRDSLRAARGVMRLIRFHPEWREDFDLDSLGFVRSFFAQALRLPALLLFAAVLARALGERVSNTLLLQNALGAGLALLAYLAMSLTAVRLLKLGGWRAFITLLNWGDLVFSVGIACLSALTLGGAPGLAALRIIWLVVFVPMEVMFVWRAAQVTLRTDVSATVLLVVLNIAASVGADQLAEMILPT